MSLISKFLFRLGLFSALVFLIGYFICTSVSSRISIVEFSVIQILVIVVTSFVHYYLISSASSVERPQQMVVKFMATTVFKLFFYVFVGVSYIVLTKYFMQSEVVYSALFVVFFVLYLLYSFFEVFWIVKFMKTNVF